MSTASLRLVVDQWRGIDPDHGEFHVVAYSDGSQRSLPAAA